MLTTNGKLLLLLLMLNAHDKDFLSPPSMKMATEHVTGFFLAYTHFFAFIRDYTPIFGKYFHGKDVEKPETLKNLKASCLIKMINPSFEAFKLAFLDPKSRVRLNTDSEEKYYSRIESLSAPEGYLDELYIEFSEHLNAVIGI